MKHVLIATDFSPHALSACRYAVAMARDLGYGLKIIHVDFMGTELHDGLLAGNPVPWKHAGSPEQTLEERMGDLIALLEKDSGEDFVIEGFVRKGVPSVEILRFADEYSPEMIVVGVKPRSKAFLLFFGSVAIDLMVDAHQPVLAIPQEARYVGINRFVYACNFDPADEAGLANLTTLLSPFGEVGGICLHIAEEFNEEAQELEFEEIRSELGIHLGDALGSGKIQVEVVAGGKLLPALEEYLLQEKIDLLAVTTHMQGDFFRILNPSASQELMFHTQIPLLIFHA